MNYQNYKSIPKSCVPSKEFSQKVRDLHTVYSSKCNDHLTPQVNQANNLVKNIRSERSWSNVRGYGFIVMTNCEGRQEHKPWNRIPSLIRGNERCF